MGDERTGLGPWQRGGKLPRGSAGSENREKPKGKRGLGSFFVVVLGFGGILVFGSFSVVMTIQRGNAPTALQREPSYIKAVVAYKEGTGAMVVYFVLATATGEETRADGTVRLWVYEEAMNTDTYKMEDRWLWTLLDIRVAVSDFHTAEVGLGAFAHKQLICSLGRISYSRFHAQPSEMTGTVKVLFITTSGRELYGEGSIFF